MLVIDLSFVADETNGKCTDEAGNRTVHNFRRSDLILCRLRGKRVATLEFFKNGCKLAADTTVKCSGAMTTQCGMYLAPVF